MAAAGKGKRLGLECELSAFDECLTSSVRDWTRAGLISHEEIADGWATFWGDKAHFGHMEAGDFYFDFQDLVRITAGDLIQRAAGLPQDGRGSASRFARPR